MTNAQPFHFSAPMPAFITPSRSVHNAPRTAPDAARSGGSLALQDKLARCMRQLGDWQACPSAKTPEGKKIIENLQAQIGNIESRLQSAPDAAAQQATETATTDRAAAPSPRAGNTSLGGLVDVYA